MRKTSWLLAVVVCWGLYTCQAEASVLDWPLISQGTSIVKCVVEDAGKLVVIVTTHLTQAATESLTVVKECVEFVVREATPLPDSPDHV